MGTQQRLRGILEQVAADNSDASGSSEQKLGGFYASCMNEPRVKADGVKPLEPELQRIRAMVSMSDLQAEVARLQSQGVEAVFGFSSAGLEG